MIANDNALGAGRAEYAHDTLKVQRLAVVDDRTAYGQGLADVFAATANKRGMAARLMGGDGICAPLSALPKGKAWKARDDAEFSAAAFQLYSPNADDAAMVLAHAMMKAGSGNPKVYLKDIRDIHYDGVTNSEIHFTANGELADPIITLSEFRG